MDRSFLEAYTEALAEAALLAAALNLRSPAPEWLRGLLEDAIWMDPGTEEAGFTSRLEDALHDASFRIPYAE